MPSCFELLRLWYASNAALAPIVMATAPTTPRESAVNRDTRLGLRRVCNNASLSEEAIATGERSRAAHVETGVSCAKESSAGR